MTELTKEDISWIFQVIILNLEGKSLIELISIINPKYILLGKKTLDFIKENWKNG